MTNTLVDSCVLLDIFTNDPVWLVWSEENLERCGQEGDLYINALIYSEISVGFNKIEELESTISEIDLRRLDLPYEAAFLAGKAFLRYKKMGGKRLSTLPDFYIGAHAAVSGLRLLTRDARRFNTYFPTVTLIAP